MDINEQIAANRGLIYSQLYRFKLADDPDAESYAYEALYKAIQTYDANANTAFSTYAVCVIANELRKHLRHLNRKRQLEVVSYNATIQTGTDTISYLDTLYYDTDAESEVLFKELQGVVRESFLKVYNSLNDTHKAIIKAWYDSEYKLRQKEIAELMQLSQPSVSRALSAFKYKLRLELEEYM